MAVTFGAGKIGNCAQFNGSSYLNTGTPPDFTLAGDWTVTGWARTPDPSGVQQTIVSRSGRFEFRVYFAEGNIGANAYDSSDIVLTAAANTWSYFRLAFVSGTQTIEFEINNDGNVQTASPGGDVEDSGAPVLIGTQDQGGGPANFLTGDVDAIKIWSRLLTSGEQAEDYNGGAGLEF